MQSKMLSTTYYGRLQ